MNPVVKTIPHQTVVQVGDSVTFLDLLKMQGNKKYYKTYRNTGEDAPDAPVNLKNPRIPATSEWVEMDSYITTHKSPDLADVYVYCCDGSPDIDGVLYLGQFTGFDFATSSGFSEPFNLAVSKGLVPGHTIVDKYGENSDIDTSTAPEDIWEYGGEYTYDTDGTAPIVSLISDSALDTQEIMVEGLDIDGNLVEQTVVLTGTTRVALTTPLWRVFRMYNNDSFDIEGTVYCYTTTGNTPADANIRAIIDDGNNQTLMAMYTVPKGYVGFLYRGELGCSRSQNTGSVQCTYKSRRFGKVFRIKKRVNLTNQGTSIYVDNRTAPDAIPALTDIKLTVEDVSANNIGVFGTLDIMLVDASLFSTEFLESIGQPS